MICGCCAVRALVTSLLLAEGLRRTDYPNNMLLGEETNRFPCALLRVCGQGGSDVFQHLQL